MIEFQEAVGAPLGFILHKSASLALPFDQWTTLSLPYIILPAGLRRFQIPIIAGEPRAFFRIEAIIHQ